MEDYDLPARLVTEQLLADLSSGKIVVSEVGVTLPGISEDKQLQFLLELTEAYNDGKLELDKFFTAIGAAGLAGDISTDLGHAIWLCSLKPSTNQEHLGELAAECVKKGKLSKRCCLELQELELSQQAGVVASAQQLVLKERRVNTATYYKQDKYNLLREENEGYGKLLTALLSGGQLTAAARLSLEREVRSLVGSFKLDPNRVCDLVLEAAERDQAGVGEWLRLLGLFHREAPMQMLAMKFLHYQQQHRGAAAGEEEGEAEAAGGRRGGGAGAGAGGRGPPASLYQLAAAMIKSGHATLEGLLPYLSPTAEQLAASYQAALASLKEEAAAAGQAVLGGGGDDGGRAGGAQQRAPGGGGQDAGGGGGGGDGRRSVALLQAANLDEIASRRGITNTPDDRMGGRGGPGGMPPGGMMAGPGGQPPPPPGMPPPGAMWQRGMPPPGAGGPMGGAGGQYGQPNGHMGGMPMGGMPMGGMRGGGGGSGMMPAAPPGGGGGGGRGGGGGAAYEASYNVMPASQLELDARGFDRPLLDPAAPQLQLLAALTGAGDWEHALLLLDWLRDSLGVQAASDAALCASLLSHLRRLLQPLHQALFPKGALGGSVLRRPPYSTAAARAAAPPPQQKGAAAAATAAAPKAPGPAIDDLAYRLVGHVGVYLYRDPDAMVELLRCLRHEALFSGRLWPPPPAHVDAAAVDGGAVQRVSAVMAEAVLPALTLFPASAAMSGEVWDVLELLPFPDRAEIYRRAAAAAAAAPPAAAAGALAVKAFKKIKARLALPDRADRSRKDVVRANASLLAKVTHAAPLQVAEQVMWWAGGSPNAVEPLAEVMKLPNVLTQDALTYVALSWWSRLGKPKMKQDGANEEDWVAGLADLIGYACRAHPHSSFDLSAIVRFAFDGLKGGDALDALLLRSLVSRMAGIDGPVSLDASQAQLLCAGHVLQAELIHSVPNRAEGRFVKGRRALLEVLVDGPSPDRRLLVPLAVALSQALDYALYALPAKYIKEVAELHDRINDVIQQYLMLVDQCVRHDKTLDLGPYAASLPPPHQLITELGVQPGVAWGLWRPVLEALEPELMAGLEAKAAAAAAAAAAAGEGDDGDELLALLSSGASGGGAKPPSRPPSPGADGEEGEVPEEGEAMQGVEGPGAKAASTAAAAAAAAAKRLQLPVTLADVAASVGRIEPPVLSTMRETLYMAFWSLRAEDIHVPTGVYNEQIAAMDKLLRSGPGEASRLRQEVEAERNALDRVAHQGRGPRGGQDMENRIIDALTRKQGALAEIEKKLEHAKAVIGPLRAERDAMVDRHREVMRRLEAEKDAYVPKGVRIKAHNKAFIQHCLVPRLTRSVTDAVYCHHFTMAMHRLDVPQWPAGFFWDEAVTSLTCMIPTVTEKEALCLGLFLTLLLQELQVWYFDPTLYRRDCDRQTMRHSANDPKSVMAHAQFARLFRKWQNGLHKSLKQCATGSEYLQKRNALVVMSKMIQASPAQDKPPMFPVFRHHNAELSRVMDAIMENDAREDVKKMAQALKIQLHNSADKCQDEPSGKAAPGGKMIDLSKGRQGAAARRPPPVPVKPAAGSRPATPPAGAGGGGGTPTKPEAAGAVTAGKGGEGGSGGGGEHPVKAVRKPAGAPAAAGGNAKQPQQPQQQQQKQQPQQPQQQKQQQKQQQQAGSGGRPPGAKTARPAGSASEDEPASKRARVSAPAGRPQQAAGGGGGGEELGELPGPPAAADGGGPAGAGGSAKAAPKGKPPAAAAAAPSGKQAAAAAKLAKGGARKSEADGGGGGKEQPGAKQQPEQDEGRQQQQQQQQRPKQEDGERRGSHHQGAAAGDAEAASAPASPHRSSGGGRDRDRSRGAAGGGGGGGGGRRDSDLPGPPAQQQPQERHRERSRDSAAAGEGGGKKGAERGERGDKGDKEDGGSGKEPREKKRRKDRAKDKDKEKGDKGEKQPRERGSKDDGGGRDEPSTETQHKRRRAEEERQADSKADKHGRHGLVQHPSQEHGRDRDRGGGGGGGGGGRSGSKR